MRVGVDGGEGRDGGGRRVEMENTIQNNTKTNIIIVASTPNCVGIERE